MQHNQLSAHDLKAYCGAELKLVLRLILFIQFCLKVRVY